jgi:hypothetical protein
LLGAVGHTGNGSWHECVVGMGLVVWWMNTDSQRE